MNTLILITQTLYVIAGILYDLSGKKIIPFATSGTSGMGETNSKLANSCKGAELIEGKRFDTKVSTDELKKLAENYI